MPLKLYRRGKIWHFRGTVAGRRVRGSCKTADQAIAARQAAEIEAREWKCNFDGPEAVLTFSQAALMYRGAGRPTRFLDRIEDYWKDTLVKNIKAAQIRQMAMTLYPAAGNATRNRQAIVPCQAIINHAAESELCSFIRTKRFKTLKKIKPPFTLEWLLKFYEHRTNDYIGALALFIFAGGPRISEALAVFDEHLDLPNGTAIIPKSKISEQRMVHLPAKIVSAIANLPKVPGRPVFWYRKRADCMRAWDATVKAAGIKRMTPHSGRHGFATDGLQRLRLDPKTVMWLGGWKSTRLFLDTYAHAIQDITLTDRMFDPKLTRATPSNVKNPRKTGTT